MTRLIVLLIFGAAVPNFVELASHSRTKRTVVSGISNWWYGTTEAPPAIEPIYDFVAQRGIAPTAVDVVQDPEYDDELDVDLGRLAQELGVEANRLPPIEDVVEFIGAKTKREAIDTIREYAQTAEGLEMIQFYLDDEQTRERRQLEIENDVDRFRTDAELVEQITESASPPGFFGRVGYYLNFLNPFSGRSSVAVPLPQEQQTSDYVTVRPPTYKYPEGYNPQTHSYSKEAPTNRAIAPFRIDINDGSLAPEQIEKIRNQLSLQRRILGAQQTHPQLVPILYQGRVYFMPYPPLLPAPGPPPFVQPYAHAVAPDLVPFESNPELAVAEPDTPKLVAETPEEPAQVTEITQEIEENSDSSGSASEQSRAIIAAPDPPIPAINEEKTLEENQGDQEPEPSVDIETIQEPEPSVDVETIQEPEPEPEPEIVTTKEDQEDIEPTNDVIETIPVRSTKLRLLTPEEPQRLSHELAASGRVQRLNPDAMDAAINPALERSMTAVKTSPSHENLFEMISHLTADPRNEQKKQILTKYPELYKEIQSYRH